MTVLVTELEGLDAACNCGDRIGESGRSESRERPTRERRAHGLRVVLPKRTYQLPWARFLAAEGAPDTVRAVFSMYDVVVTGCGFDALLADLAAQVVTVLHQPLRAETFSPAATHACRPWRSAGLKGVGPRDRR
jgi:hypothetical protein